MTFSVIYQFKLRMQPFAVLAVNIYPVFVCPLILFMMPYDTYVLTFL